MSLTPNPTVQGKNTGCFLGLRTSEAHAKQIGVPYKRNRALKMGTAFFYCSGSQLFASPDKNHQEMASFFFGGGGLRQNVLGIGSGS